ncbi:WD40 repeat domain-containing serine/threonine protein kinase [Nonomuraea sp. NPDC052265]|uniref:WD40 repeat domain-containing serine/threonine protein kinase n=1 Tax=Nonomuraea sp. NPDC052265 TaxID=3364374 RepID=UPI0037C595C6
MVELRPLRSGEPREVAGYRLLGRLGDGGQGSVFLGRDADGGHAAVKILHPRLLGDERATRRFLRESTTAAKVAGSRTARIYGSGVAEGRPYIVSEFIDGPSLHDLVLDGGPLTVGELERLAAGTITALTAVHGAGIVHRDFKPSNVLMGQDGPRVIDFGIAKDMDVSTTASSVVGTPGYMSPEQIAGEGATAASDVFSWAATVGFAATGEPLFGRDSIPAVMNRILHAEPDLREVPEPLRAVLRACLAKEPVARPSAYDVLARLLGRTAAAPRRHASGRARRDPDAAPREPRRSRRDADAGPREPRRLPRNAGEVPRDVRPGPGPGPGPGTRRGWAAAGVGVLVALGVVAGVLWRNAGFPAVEGPTGGQAAFGVELGPEFGPASGANVAAMAIGHHKGAPVVAYAEKSGNSIEVWDPRIGEPLDRLPDAGPTPVRSLVLIPVGGRQTAVWTGTDGIVRRWRIGDARPGAWHVVCRSEARLAPGQWRKQPAVVIGCPDGQVVTLDLASDRIVARDRPATGPVTALAWDETTGKALVGTGRGLLGAPAGPLGKGEVRSVAAFGDGRAAVTTGGSTAVYDLDSGAFVRGFTTGAAGVGVTAAGGRRMIAGGGDGVTVWNADRGERLGDLAPGRKVTGLAAGDGLLVVATGSRLQAWSLASTG